MWGLIITGLVIIGVFVWWQKVNRAEPLMPLELLKDRKVVLDLTDGARTWLGRVGYDPVYGARPLKRAVQRYLQDPLADLILRGEVPDGSTGRVEDGDGALVLTVG